VRGLLWLSDELGSSGFRDDDGTFIAGFDGSGELFNERGAAGDLAGREPLAVFVAGYFSATGAAAADDGARTFWAVLVVAGVFGHVRLGRVRRDIVADTDRFAAPAALDRHLADALETVVGAAVFFERHAHDVALAECYGRAFSLRAMAAHIGNVRFSEDACRGEPENLELNFDLLSIDLHFSSVLLGALVAGY